MPVFKIASPTLLLLIIFFHATFTGCSPLNCGVSPRPSATHLGHPNLPTQNTPASGSYLELQLGYAGIPSPGSTIQLKSTLIDVGSFEVNVTALNFKVDFAPSFNQSTGLGIIYQGQSRVNNTPLAIPLSTSIGNHSITASVRWWYYTTGWNQGTPLILNGTIPVKTATTPSSTSGPSITQLLYQNLGLLIIGLAIYMVIVPLATGLVIRRDRQKQRKLTRALNHSNVA